MIKNGNIYDIGQTVNGVSRFLWFNEKWYYFEERMSREYEYDQKDLTDTVNNISYLEDVTLLGNIFSEKCECGKDLIVTKSCKICDNDE